MYVAVTSKEKFNQVFKSRDKKIHVPLDKFVNKQCVSVALPRYRAVYVRTNAQVNGNPHPRGPGKGWRN